MVNGIQLFLVKWENWDEKTNTWEPLEHLQNCGKVLEDFLTASLGDQVLLELRDRVQLKTKIEDDSLLLFIPKGGFAALPPKIDVQRQLLKLAVSKSSAQKTISCVKKLLHLYMLLLRREAQQQQLCDWEKEIKQISSEVAVLRIENDVDLEGPPTGFIFVNSYIAAEGIVIPNDPPIGCDCVKCWALESACCGVSLTAKDKRSFAYKKNRVRVPQGTPIYECNKRCKCSPDSCGNRVVQRGRRIPLSIYRTSNGCGWGVKALRRIHRGEFVCEYVGEVITYEEAERRGRQYDAEGRTYLFDLDFNATEFPYTVDAATYGNVSHFINHSCSPNLAVWAVWVNCLDPNIPRLALFATREIKRDEELTFDYMSNNRSSDSSQSGASSPGSPGGKATTTTVESPSRPRLDVKLEGVEDGTKRVVCKCFADKCRRYLF